MSHSPRIALLAVCLFCACISLPEIEQVPETPDAGEPDAHVEDSGTPDASAPDSGTPDSGTPAVTVTLVTSRAVTNSAVHVSATVTGATPDEVELLVDGVRLAVLMPPDASYTWDTTSSAEGEHVLRARVTVAGRSYTSSEHSVVVDRTPPRVLSRNPAPGAEGVSIRESIQATFDEPLDATTLTEASAQLHFGAKVVARTATLSDDGRTLTAAPSASLMLPGTLKLSLSTQLTDLAGNALQLPADEWIWSLPEFFRLPALNASGGTANAVAPVVQVDRNGRPLVVWREAKEDGAGLRTYVSRWSGAFWESLGAPSGGDPAAASGLQLDELGNPVVAWSRAEQETRLFVSGWRNGQWHQFGAPLSAHSGPSTSVYDIALRLDRDGNPVVAWMESDGSVSRVYVQRWTGSDWSAVGGALAATRESWQVMGVSLVLDAGSSPVVAVFEQAPQVVTPPCTIRVWKWEQGNWSPVGNDLGDLGCFGGNPSLALDGDGRPVVAFMKQVGSTTLSEKIHVSRWNNGAWESVGGPLSARSGYQAARWPRLGVAGNGTLTVAWSEFTNQMREDIFARQWAGDDWVPLGGALGALAGETEATKPSLALDSHGAVVLAWHESDGTVASVQVLLFNQ